MPEWNDDVLIEGITRRDDVAVAQFYRRFGPRLLAMYGASHPGINDADDTVQDTLVAAIAQIQAGHFDRRSSLAHWVLAIFENQRAGHARKAQRRQRLVPIHDVEGDVDGVVAERGGVEGLSAPEYRVFVKEVLLKLEPRERLALLLNVQGGLPARVIATLLQIGPKSAEALVTKAKKRFVELAGTRKEKALVALLDRENRDG